MRTETESQERRLRALEAQLGDMRNSASWRLTAPLRLFTELFRRSGRD
jgi:hypothetical protein